MILIINQRPFKLFTRKTLTLLERTGSLLFSAQIFAQTGIEGSDTKYLPVKSIIHDGKISLTLRDVSIAEVMEMLSRAAKSQYFAV